ncbi:MAG: apolipoprotein A1/A4/E family protein [Chloracidobacterium sp.]|nr:apolipoprotein A1/A4/E family protein [Chloracidobacterium sp.]
MAAFANWESQLQARAEETLARRARELKDEFERLQGAISEIGARLTEQDRVLTGAESSSLIEEIKRWLDERAAKAEEDFRERTAKAEEDFKERAAKAEEDFKERAAKAEEDFKSRLEETAANARREADIQIEELREQLEVSRQALTATSLSSPQTISRSFETFTTASEDIVSQRTQSDTIASLVRQAAEFAPRVVFFIIKSGDAIGWKARGFENGLNDETVKLLTVPAQKPALLRDAIANLRVATSDPQSTDAGGVVSEALGIYGSPSPKRAIAIPLVVLNKAVAVLYADSGAQPEDSLNSVAAESLTRIAGKTIEFWHSRRENARPAAQPAETSPATPRKTDSKALGAAIQQTTPQLGFQPAAQVDTVGGDPGHKIDSVGDPGHKQDSPPEIHREIHEGARRREKYSEPTDTNLERITMERRRTQELPQGFNKEKGKGKWKEKDPQVTDFDKDSNVGSKVDAQIDAPAAVFDEGLRQAEAQLPEPGLIETEPGASPESRTGLSESSDIGASGGSGRLRSTTMTPAPSLPPIEVEQEQAITDASLKQLSDAAHPAEEPPASSDTPVFSPPPAPPIFTPPPKPPKPAQSVSSVSGSETEQRAHNDARRFARLLVSEIKLYNAAKVNDGRRNYDLYDRLKDEIDRNRKVYDKRVAPTVAARIDYFYEELVQTLAEGDPAKLGKDCPGPVAVA